MSHKNSKQKSTVGDRFLLRCIGYHDVFLKLRSAYLVLRSNDNEEENLIAAVVVVVISSTVGYSIFARNRGVIAVQSGQVLRQDLTQTVSANGEIKPKKYVNVSSNMMGRIVRLPVKEGDHVRDGELSGSTRIHPNRSGCSVRREASLDAAQTEVEGMAASIRSGEAAITSAKAEITRAEADLARAKQNFDRAERMSKEGLIRQGSIRSRARPISTSQRLR